MVTWYRREKRSGVGALVRSVQTDRAGSVLCCKTKFADGTTQEMLAAAGIGAMATAITGAGVLRRTQIRPFDGAANSTLPSALDATPCQERAGTLFEVHVEPESLEVEIWPWKATAASFVASADEATPSQTAFAGKPVSVQDAPRLLDKKIPPVDVAASKRRP